MTAAVSSEDHRGAFVRLRDYVTRRPGFLRNIVVFLIMAVIGTVVFALFVGQEDLILPWQHTTSYYADFADASAIAPGQHQEIRVAGVHVGDIGSASVTRGGLAHVQLQITDNDLKIYTNAHALLQAKTPLNEMYIELNPGSPTATSKLMTHDSTIPLAQTTSPIEVDQILQHLGPSVQTSARILLEQTNATLVDASDYLPNDLTQANSTLTNLQPVAAALTTRAAEIRTLVSDLAQIAGVAGGNQTRLAQILNTAETTLNTVAGNDSGLSATLADLPGTTQALGRALPKVQNLVGQLNPLLNNVRASSTILPKALDQLNATLKNADPLVKVLQPVITNGNPLMVNLRSYLGSANPSLAVLDQISGQDLKPLTSYVSYDLPWLNGFFDNTNSVSSVGQGPKAGQTSTVRSIIVTGSQAVYGFCDQLVGPINSLGSVGSLLGSTVCNGAKTLLGS